VRGAVYAHEIVRADRDAARGDEHVRRETAPKRLAVGVLVVCNRAQQLDLGTRRFQLRGQEQAVRFVDLPGLELLAGAAKLAARGQHGGARPPRDGHFRDARRRERGQHVYQQVLTEMHSSARSSGKFTPEFIRQQIESARADVRKLVVNVNEIHQELSRHLTPSTELFSASGTPVTRIDRGANLLRLFVIGVARRLAANARQRRAGTPLRPPSEAWKRR